VKDKDFNWEEVVNNKELLLYFLRKYTSQREVARFFDKDHKAVKYWMDKHDIEVKDYRGYDYRDIDVKEYAKRELNKVKPKVTTTDNEVSINEEKTNSENNPTKKADEFIKETDDYVEFEDYYVLYLKDQDYKLSKETLKEFKDLYCGPAQMTLAQCSRELRIPRKKLKDIKNIFNITHAAIPFLEEEMKEKSVDELTEEALAKKENLFFRKLQQKEYDKAIKELEKYKKKDFYFNRAVNKIIEEINDLDYRPPELYEVGRENPEEVSVVINITDWHKGKLVQEEKILGDGGYDKYKFDEMVEKYINEALLLIEEKNPEKVYILNYGDGVDGPNSSVYDGQRKNQDVFGENQIIEYAKDLKDFVLSIYDYQPNIYYSSVPGNHSKGDNNADALANKILEELLIGYDSIEFDVEKKKHKIIDVYDSRIVQTHGQDIRTGTYTGENDIMNIINMEGLPFKQTYVVHGHLHHERVEGTRYKRIFLPSPVGGDQLSNNTLYTTSRPSQVMFAIKEGEGIKSEHHVYFD